MVTQHNWHLMIHNFFFFFLWKKLSVDYSITAFILLTKHKFKVHNDYIRLSKLMYDNSQ